VKISKRGTDLKINLPLRGAKKVRQKTAEQKCPVKKGGGEGCKKASVDAVKVKHNGE